MDQSPRDFPYFGVLFRYLLLPFIYYSLPCASCPWLLTLHAYRPRESPRPALLHRGRSGGFKQRPPFESRQKQTIFEKRLELHEVLSRFPTLSCDKDDKISTSEKSGDAGRERGRKAVGGREGGRELMLVLDILAYYLPDCVAPVCEPRPLETRRKIAGQGERKVCVVFLCAYGVFVFKIISDLPRKSYLNAVRPRP